MKIITSFLRITSRLMIPLTIPTVILALVCFFIPVPLLSAETVAAPQATKKLNYRFDGDISRSVLENYLARSATVASLLHYTLDDDLRMMRNTGVKFAGLFAGSQSKCKPSSGLKTAPSSPRRLPKSLHELRSSEKAAFQKP